MMNKRANRFVQLSAALTGFSQVDLLGTGMAVAHLRTLEVILPTGIMDDLFMAGEGVASGTEPEGVAGPRLLDDPKLGPVVRNLILLWYCGVWTALPDAWRAAHGASPLDVTHVVSAEAYRAGLQWVAAGAHAAGAAQQGFGAWALPPEVRTP